MTLTREQLTAHGYPLSSVIWSPTLNFVCASCHLAWGCLITLVLCQTVGQLWALLFIPVIVAKELLVDVRIEYPQPPTGEAYIMEAFDLVWYGIGIGLGHGLAALLSR